MIEELKIEVCQQQDVQKIADGINSYNFSKVAPLNDTRTVLDFVAKNSKGIEVGGILASIGYWNGLEIRILWVNDNFRGTGIGSKLLKHVEAIAKEKGATISLLDTFDFQAEGFYLKNGYQVFGEVKDFPEGHRRIYLSKKLND